MTHTATHPDDPEAEAPIAPDQQEGAWTNCDCADCRERRLGDSFNSLYTPHDVADAWARGFWAGMKRGMERPGG